MADRPIAPTSRESTPRMRSQSTHLSSCTPVTLRTKKPRTTFKQRSPTKGKGAGKGKKASKKSNKQIEVVSSDSEDLEVDFLNYHPNQYRPSIYHGRNQEEVTETITITPEIGHIAENGIKSITEEEEITATEIIDPITETTVGPETEIVIGTTVGMTIDQITGEMIIIEGMAIEIKITVSPEIKMKETEAVPGKVLSPGMDHKTDTGTEGRAETTTETDLKLDPDPHPE